MNNYSWNICCDNFIAHYGKGHDENPPGRGSGRYPWGSGAKNGKHHKHKFEDHSASDTSLKKKMETKILSETLGVGIGAGVVVGTAFATGQIAYPFVASTVLNTAQLSTDVGKYVYNSLRDMKATKNEKKLNEMRKDSPIDKKTGFHLKTKEMSAEEDLVYVNPGYKNWDANTKNNCVLCTVAYELRRRGYDVQANKASIGYNDIDLMPDYFKGAKYTFIDGSLTDDEIFKYEGVNSPERRSKMADNAYNNIKNQPNGARGEVSMMWNDSYSGHAFSYANENGLPVIYDSQSASMTRDEEKIKQFFYCGSQIQICRLDNLELNTKYIKEVAN